MIPNPNSSILKKINPKLFYEMKQNYSRIELWKEKLFELSYVEFFIVGQLPNEVFQNETQIANYKNSAGYYTFEHSDSNIGIGDYSSFAPSSFNKIEGNPFDRDLIISAGTFITQEQWYTQKAWFEVTGSSDLRFDGYLAINFRLNNKAEIVDGYDYTHTNDELLMWPKERYLFKGTWAEVYNHLITLIEEAVSGVTIPPPIGYDHINNNTPLGKSDRVVCFKH